ncbi:MAG: hypothetical protein V4629_07715 [Pseudomonadota bacterium]
MNISTSFKAAIIFALNSPASVLSEKSPKLGNLRATNNPSPIFNRVLQANCKLVVNGCDLSLLQCKDVQHSFLPGSPLGDYNNECGASIYSTQGNKEEMLCDGAPVDLEIYCPEKTLDNPPTPAPTPAKTPAPTFASTTKVTFETPAPTSASAPNATPETYAPTAAPTSAPTVAPFNPS